MLLLFVQRFAELHHDAHVRCLGIFPAVTLVLQLGLQRGQGLAQIIDLCGQLTGPGRAASLGITALQHFQPHVYVLPHPCELLVHVAVQRGHLADDRVATALRRWRLVTTSATRRAGGCHLFQPVLGAGQLHRESVHVGGRPLQLDGQYLHLLFGMGLQLRVFSFFRTESGPQLGQHVLCLGGHLGSLGCRPRCRCR